jgi:large subunit ribosomal protein L4
MESIVYNQKGEKSGKISLSDGVFNLPWNGDLVHQVVVSMMSNARTPVAHTKTRGEVSGGGKKPWKQKGTGRARHGSIRSPLWVGGGVTHGPRKDKNFFKKINKKMKAKALLTILSKKNKEGEIIFVDSIRLPEMKTKHAVPVLHALAGVSGFEGLAKKMKMGKNTAYLALPEGELTGTRRAFQNIQGLEISTLQNLNPLDLLNYKYLIIANPKETLPLLEGKVSRKKVKAA